MDGWPALYASPTSPVPVPDIIVVGAVDYTWKLWRSSQRGTFVAPHAPGGDVSVASAVGTGYHLSNGTSIGM